MKNYDFLQQKNVGDQGEAIVKAYLESMGWEVSAASSEEQLEGVPDLVGVNRFTRVPKTWEVKTDAKTIHTGKVAIETIKNTRTGAVGWAYTCKASELLYWVPGYNLLFSLAPSTIRRYVASWRSRWPSERTQTGKYQTEFVLIPIMDFAEFSFAISDLTVFLKKAQSVVCSN